MLATLLGCLLATAAVATRADIETSTGDGVYTAEQAGRGEQQYETFCAHCHATSYFQGTFLSPWHGQSVATLNELIMLKMPEDRPGAMSEQDYTELMAYILALNGYPAGAHALDAPGNAMRQVRISPLAAPE